jgi:hypothetical protein
MYYTYTVDRIPLGRKPGITGSSSSAGGIPHSLCTGFWVYRKIFVVWFKGVECGHGCGKCLPSGPRSCLLIKTCDDAHGGAWIGG